MHYEAGGKTGRVGSAGGRRSITEVPEISETVGAEGERIRGRIGWGNGEIDRLIRIDTGGIAGNGNGVRGCAAGHVVEEVDDHNIPGWRSPNLQFWSVRDPEGCIV